MSVDLFGDEIELGGKNALRRRFTVPPFTDLNAREGWWQDRKRWWQSLGIDPEVNPKGRGDGLTHNTADWFAKHGKTGGSNSTSIFDPTLCELAYRWFCPEGGQIIDPFAGGSVRGIVAHKLGRKYWGCDLRQEQIDANEQQGAEICPENPPAWICGDALDVLPNAPLADFAFSCPPYGGVERYSDDPLDLSTMEYHTFMPTLKRVILRCWERLKDNRFAAFVVGEFRDKKGNYRNFVGDTVSAFMDAGFHYYNEAIVITAIGSLPIRVTKQFTASRKMGKTHQNLLIFVKGDGKKAAQNIEESGVSHD